MSGTEGLGSSSLNLQSGDSISSENFTPRMSLGNWLWPLRRRQLRSTADLTGLFEPDNVRKLVRGRSLEMPRGDLNSEQIVVLLGQIELTSQGKTPAVACRSDIGHQRHRHPQA